VKVEDPKSFLVCLRRLIALEWNDVIDVDKVKSFEGDLRQDSWKFDENGLMYLDSNANEPDYDSLPLLDPIDDYEPFSVSVDQNEMDGKEWTPDRMDGYAPLTWRPRPPDAFAEFFLNPRASPGRLLICGFPVAVTVLTNLKACPLRSSLIELVSVIVCGGAALPEWRPGHALYNPLGTVLNAVIPLHWYEEMYNDIRDFCLEKSLATSTPCYVMLGDGGIGKSTFVTYLVSRWVGDGRWYNNKGNEIDTILILVKGSGTPGNRSWVGLRRSDDGKVVHFFLVEDGYMPSDNRKIPMKEVFLINIAEHTVESVVLGEMDLDSERTLCIFDSLDDKYLRSVEMPLVVRIPSIGNYCQEPGLPKNHEVWIPLPTDSDMGKIFCMADWKKRSEFRTRFEIAGYDVGACVCEIGVSHEWVQGVLTGIALELFNGNDLTRRLYDKTMPHWQLLQADPVRCAPWKGFKSLQSFEVRYRSTRIEKDVSARIVHFLTHGVMNISKYLESWNSSGKRILLKIIEAFFQEFVGELGIQVLRREFTVRQRRPKPGLSEDSVSLRFDIDRETELKENDLCDGLSVVNDCSLDRIVAVGGKKGDIICFQTGSLKELCDAIIVPRNETSPIDILKIKIMNENHIIQAEAFRELFRIPGFERRNFRFFIIGVVLSQETFRWIQHESLKCKIGRLNGEVPGFPERVIEWYECFFNLERALANHLSRMRGLL
jgi:hypothetical protein